MKVSESSQIIMKSPDGQSTFIEKKQDLHEKDKPYSSIYLFAFDTLSKSNSQGISQNNNSSRGVLKLFIYFNKSFEYKSEYSFSSTIRQILEIDPKNGIFGVVMDNDDGIFILRIDYITGDYKMTLKQTLYKNQGLNIKHVSAINSSFLLIIAERRHTITKSYKIE